MKIMHLADLHIGKTLYEQSLLEDQKYMLNQIIEIIKNENIEAVMIAGDVYDRSIPSAEAVDVLNDFLSNIINGLKIKVFIISGNHDSKERLNFGSQIFKGQGLYIVTNYDGKIEKVELDENINIYMLPFVKPQEVQKYLIKDGEVLKENLSYEEMMKRIIANEKIDDNKTNILMCHQFITAVGEETQTCESETLNVGTLDNIDFHNFDNFDYVALGHIHGPQKVGRESCRYAGTILKYSFSEANHKKSVAVLDVQKESKIDYKLIPLIPDKDMREIKGPIEELLKEENYKGTNQNDYIRAIITNKEPIYDAIGQIRSVYPNVLSLIIENQNEFEKNEYDLDVKSIKEKTTLELFESFYEFQNNQKLNERQIEIIEELIKDI